MNINWQNATFGDLVRELIGIINVLIYVVFAITLVVIIWQIIRAWIIGGGDPQKREEGKKTILIGFIVLVAMASVWGIVALLRTIVY